MKNRTIMATITKRGGICILLGLLFLAMTAPAAAQDSMIPDDFDWSTYLQNWQDTFIDGWGAAPQPGYPVQDPFYYEWYGETNELDMWGSDPYQQGTGTGTSDYTQVPVYNDPYAGWGSYNPGESSDDGWFYQLPDGFFDDFGDWDRSEIPASAYVSGFNGVAQSYNLDCEARSAVDLAAYFGVNISHSDFLYALPKSDDPNVGFVGYFNDARGHIPPASYGVYQEPVAALLRQYGLNAVGVYAYSEEALKRQIAAGHPVMVWVVGNTEIGYSVPYTPASTGKTTYVVPYQHTVVVIGYDGNAVTIQDGGMRYSREWKTFLVSWGALGNRAIYVK